MTLWEYIRDYWNKGKNWPHEKFPKENGDKTGKKKKKTQSCQFVFTQRTGFETIFKKKLGIWPQVKA